MKHTKRIVVFTASLLAIAGESVGQSGYERAHLEVRRWVVLNAKESAVQAREVLAETKKEFEEHQPVIERARNDASLDSAGREIVGRRLGLLEAQLIAAQASLSAAEARIVTAEAVFAAVQASSEEDLLVADAAHKVVQEAVILVLEKLGEISEIWQGYSKIKANPTSGILVIVWANAALAAQAAERAEAIMDALNDGGEIPQELLEPLPTEFPDLA